jgi:excisionase family DNA binding protein
MRYLSVSEAAATLGLSVRGLRARAERGEMAAHRLGPRVWAIAEEEVERWRSLGRQRPGPKPALSAEGQIMLALVREIARRDAKEDGAGFPPGWHRIHEHLEAIKTGHPGLHANTAVWQAVVRAYTEEYASFTPNNPSPHKAAAPVAAADPASRFAEKY